SRDESRSIPCAESARARPTRTGRRARQSSRDRGCRRAPCCTTRAARDRGRSPASACPSRSPADAAPQAGRAPPGSAWRPRTRPRRAAPAARRRRAPPDPPSRRRCRRGTRRRSARSARSPCRNRRWRSHVALDRALLVTRADGHVLDERFVPPVHVGERLARTNGGGIVLMRTHLVPRHDADEFLFCELQELQEQVETRRAPPVVLLRELPAADALHASVSNVDVD